jgi:spermidine/putrescine transport system permease protein
MASRAAEVAAQANVRETRRRWLLSAPALLIVFFAAAGPLLVVLLYSFMVKGDYGDVKYWQFSLDGWFSVFLQRDIFDDTITITDAHVAIFWRSVKLSMMTTGLTLVFGFPTAYFIATRPEHRRDLWLFLITIPFWTNLLIRTYAMVAVLRTRGYVNFGLEGLWNWLSAGLGALGLGALPPFQPLELLYNNAAVVIGIVYVYLPFMVLPLHATLERLDRSYLEASLDLGASQWRTFFSIVVPLARPGIISGIILVFIPALGTFLISDLLGGPDSQLIGNVIERQFKAANNWPLGAALSFLLMYLTFAALALRAALAEREV